MASSQNSEIRTYSFYSYPLDIGKIVTIPDMELSYALASTLVDWSSDKQISAGIAENWKHTVKDHSVSFKIRMNLRWSNGDLITGEQVAHSINKLMGRLPGETRSLRLLVRKVSGTETKVVFKLAETATLQQLLKKLTEPNYGIENDSTAGLGVTSGPFYLETTTPKELVLKANSRWFKYDPGMANRVVIRRPGTDSFTAELFLKDNWPNIIETTSLLDGTLLAHLKKSGNSIWRRPYDKMFYIGLVKESATENGVSKLQMLSRLLKKDLVVSGLGGCEIAHSIFPLGFLLHDGSKPPIQSENSGRPVFERPLKILAARQRVFGPLKENIRQALFKATGHIPEIMEIDIDQLEEQKKTAKADFYVGSAGLADPDPEGMMSFLFEGNAPVVFSNEKNDFVKQLDRARQIEKNGPSLELEQKKIVMMQKLLADSVSAGHVLPLFYYSTVGIGRKEIDFSQVPPSEESLTFSKIRFFKE